MLEVEIIHPSVSPYFSPFLLVQMKDGSWHMCINFWSLNIIMVNYKFSIPIINKFLDELQDAKLFSKLDL